MYLSGCPWNGVVPYLVPLYCIGQVTTRNIQDFTLFGERRNKQWTRTATFRKFKIGTIASRSILWPEERSLQVLFSLLTMVCWKYRIVALNAFICMPLETRSYDVAVHQPTTSSSFASTVTSKSNQNGKSPSNIFIGQTVGPSSSNPNSYLRA